MSAVVLVAIGLAWFYFWIRGGLGAAIFTAVMGLLWIGIIADHTPTPLGLVFLLGAPWVPCAIRLAYHEEHPTKARF